MNSQRKECPVCDCWINPDDLRKHFSFHYYDESHEEQGEIVVEKIEKVIEVCSEICSVTVLFGEIRTN